jgi:hypothetical protein
MTKILLFVLMLSGLVQAAAPTHTPCTDNPVCIDSLQQLTVENLRARHYQSQIRLLSRLGGPNQASDYTRHVAAGGQQPQSTYMAGYNSDGLQLYARLDIPAQAAPAAGFPVVVFAPGWISLQDSPGYDFGYNTESYYAPMINGFVARGFAVITAGYRGRGTVNGQPADGIEFTETWGNASYLSPIFYSLDVLNLLAGLSSLQSVDWASWGYEAQQQPRLDLARVSLLGHSQGGDVSMNTLAVVGDNPNFPQPLFAASIWAGNIPDRFTQADTFRAMASTPQAFMSGDGRWTGSATGADGSINPDFVFAWPADWIGTLDASAWTWQTQSWKLASVRDARQAAYDEMYDTLNHYVRDMQELGYQIASDDSGATVIQHHPEVAKLMPRIGGFLQHQFIDIPLALHISDRDYYSLPAWNHDLAQRLNDAGHYARVYVYPGTTHSLNVSKHRWFSPEGTEAAVAKAIARDDRLFRNGPKQH